MSTATELFMSELNEIDLKREASRLLGHMYRFIKNSTSNNLLCGELERNEVRETIDQVRRLLNQTKTSVPQRQDVDAVLSRLVNSLKYNSKSWKICDVNDLRHVVIYLAEILESE